jgi:hypothetical protein
MTALTVFKQKILLVEFSKTAIVINEPKRIRQIGASHDVLHERGVM